MKYYVYELIVVPGEVVCYVGKGSGYRMWNHRRFVTDKPRGSQCRLYRKLSELAASNKNFYPRKVFETDNELEALAFEEERIKSYPKEQLFNTAIYRPGYSTEDIDAARREAMRRSRNEYVAKLQAEYGYKMPPEVAKRIAISNTGKVMPAEAIERAVKSRMSSPEHVAWLKSQAQEMARSNIGRKQTPEHVENAAATRRGKRRSESQRANISAGLAGKASRHGAKSCYRGVTWFKPKSAWQSRISVGGKIKLLGQFKLEIDAAWAYDNAFEMVKMTRPNGTNPNHCVSRFKHGQRGKLVPI